MSIIIEAAASPVPTHSRSERYRVAFVNTHPIQYFAPLYSYLTKHSDIEVTALYLSDFSLRGGHDGGFGRAVKWDLDLLAGYKSEFMGKAASRRRMNGFFSMVAPELWPAIRGGKFDAVVIHGHNLAAHHVALLAAKASRTPVFARAETHLRLKRSSWRESVRRPVLAAWYKNFDGFLAIGTANARYYQRMGVPAHSIFSMPYSVDNQRFTALAQGFGGDRMAVRTRLGIASDAPVVLYAAKFDRRKRPDDLISACHALQSDGIALNLVMVGSGSMERELRAMVENIGMANVSFPGFVNQTELPSVYAACDLFVLPSENEPWGLAVNEAMCAGLPIVVSEEVGCAEDLVTTGVNGATFAVGHVAGLAAALRPIVADPDLRARYGEASLNRIRRWGYRECAIGLRNAIEAARVSRGATRAG
jgi:glycosyltransferase involved in cell wall biosynthesis